MARLCGVAAQEESSQKGRLVSARYQPAVTVSFGFSLLLFQRQLGEGNEQGLTQPDAETD